MERPIKILFLAANPQDTSHLRLDEEIRGIDQALHQAEYRDKFEIKQQWAVRVADLQSHLLRYKPDIVHFSGHGSSSSEIILEDNDGNSQPVSIRALSQLFSILKDDIRCVVLNACYSEQQAQAIGKHIDCVVGMSKAIGDKAAISFAIAFYQALGYGKDVKTAFDLGCVQIDLENLDEQDTPKLLATNSNPKEIILAKDSPHPYNYTDVEEKRLQDPNSTFLQNKFATLDKHDSPKTDVAKKDRKKLISSQFDAPLLEASKAGNIKSVKYYLENNGNIKTCDSEGNTPIHLASAHGNTEVVLYLLQQGADVAAINKNLSTPLHLSAKNNHLDTTKALIQYKAKINARDRNGLAPLHLCLLYPQIIECLLQNGADPDAEDNERKSLLYRAIEGDFPSTSVFYLIKYGVSLSQNKLILHHAIESKNWEAAEYLLDQKLDPKEKDSDGRSPLYLALKNKAALETIQFLVAKGADINQKDGSGNSILHYAVNLANERVLDFLLKDNSNVNEQNRFERETPLHLAVKGKNRNIIVLLCKAGANVNIKDRNGNTPLHLMMEKISAKERRIYREEYEVDQEIVELLINAGANVNEKNNSGKTPLHIAVVLSQANFYLDNGSHKRLIQLLVNTKANVNEQDNDGNTPLHLTRDKDVAKLLVLNKARLRLKNTKGKTPIDLVESRDMKEFYKFTNLAKLFLNRLIE